MMKRQTPGGSVPQPFAPPRALEFQVVTKTFGRYRSGSLLSLRVFSVVFRCSIILFLTVHTRIAIARPFQTSISPSLKSKWAMVFTFGTCSEGSSATMTMTQWATMIPYRSGSRWLYIFFTPSESITGSGRTRAWWCCPAREYIRCLIALLTSESSWPGRPATTQSRGIKSFFAYPPSLLDHLM